MAKMAHDRLFHFLLHFVPHRILALIMTDPNEEAREAYGIFDDMGLGSDIFPNKRHNTPSQGYSTTSQLDSSNLRRHGTQIRMYAYTLKASYLNPTHAPLPRLLPEIFASEACIERLDLFKRRTGLEHEYVIATVVFPDDNGVRRKVYFRIEREKDNRGGDPPSTLSRIVARGEKKVLKALNSQSSNSCAPESCSSKRVQSNF